MRLKQLAALVMAGALTASMLTGCGINKNATVATMEDGDVSLGVANFMCMFEQASNDEAYRSYGGDDVWTTDLFGTGSTMEESVKDNVMDTLHNMYTLKAHMDEYDVEITDEEQAEIKKAAEDFIAANDKDTLKELGATQDIVEEVLTLYTIQSKMYEAIIADVDTEITDEEANMRAYTMAKIQYDGYYDESYQFVSYTEEEAAEKKESAEAIVSAVEEGTDLETAATDNGCTTSTGTYDADDDVLDEEVKTALDGLSEGEVSELITTDSYYYIVRIDKETDEEATEENRTTILEERKSELYEGKLEEWQEDDNWKIKQRQFDKIEFRNQFTASSNADESADDTEADETVDGTESN